MKLEKAEIFYSQPLANKYLLNFEQVAHLYDYSPYFESSYKQRFKDVLGDGEYKRQELCHALSVYNRQLGAGEKALENIGKLADNAVVVLTGQQPGILTGPLYTIYKALAACLLAKKLSHQLQHAVVPIFWVGSEDHDFLEINHINVPSSTGPIKLELPYKVHGRPSVGSIPVLPQIQHLLQQVEEHCHGDNQHCLSKLHAITEKSSNLGNWFAAMLSWLFHDYGLVIVDSMLPEIRKQQANFFCQAIIKNKAVEHAFKTGYNEVADMGIKPQVEDITGRANLFIYQQQNRVALFRDDNWFSSRDSKIHFSEKELIEMVKSNPDQFSVNVLLKPVVTEMIFPLLAYVGGPGEIGYYGLCKHIYHLFGRKMPVIYPRPSVTLIEPRAVKYLTKYNLRSAQFITNPEECVDNFLKKTQNININDTFARFNADLSSIHRTLFLELSQLDTDIARIEQENLRAITKKIKQLQGKVEQRHRQAHQVELRQLTWLKHQLTPSGGQERTYNVMFYLAKYGENLITELGQLPLLEGVKHNLVYL